MAVRVVIAEDEAIIRLDLKETLQEQGYEVVGSHMSLVHLDGVEHGCCGPAARADAAAVAEIAGFPFEICDLTEPFVMHDGRLRVPTGPGLGVTVDEEYLRELTTSVEVVRAGTPAHA